MQQKARNMTWQIWHARGVPFAAVIKWFWPFTVVWALSAPQVRADLSDVCLSAAESAAAASDVPLSVLVAITQTETGRGQGGETQPWPWTVNMEGEGHWFENRDAALAYVFENYNRGARSFDIGCFQINFRWHGENFRSIEDMFDPTTNATYAAKFLSDLHAETGDWSAAAGAFHSRTEAQAAGYRDTFNRFRDAAIAVGADSGGFSTARAPVLLATAGDTAARRSNNFPLLQSSAGNRSLGSLVPLSP